MSILPIRPKSKERVEVTERRSIQEERARVERKQYCLSSLCINMFLYCDHTDNPTSITVVRRDNPILGEHKLDEATGLPSLEINCYRGVRPIQHIAWVFIFAPFIF